MRRGLTVVETVVAAAAAAGLVLALVTVWVQSAASIGSGGANLSNLQEAGRAFSTLRADLDRAVSVAGPYNRDGLERLQLDLLDEGSGARIPCVWSLDADRRMIVRTEGGVRREFGGGRVKRFDLRVTLLPAVAKLADARKVVVETALELAHAGRAADDPAARNFRAAHAIAPYNLNLRLQSRRAFGK